MASERKEVFDPVRKSWVAATPEEIVRQQLLKQMMELGGYPKELMSVEKELKMMPHLSDCPHLLPDRRADIVCFAQGIHPRYTLYPLLLVECKDRHIDGDAKEQVMGYNHYVRAYFVAVAAASGIELGYFDRSSNNYQFIHYLPTYSELISKIELVRRL